MTYIPRSRWVYGILPTLFFFFFIWTNTPLTTHPHWVVMGGPIVASKNTPEVVVVSSNKNLDDDVSSSIALSVVLVETDVSIWPFSHHDSNSSNSSSGNHTSNNSNTTNDKVCQDATTCDRCNSYYTCHWCAHDSTCHAIGSVYGCLIGSTCGDSKKRNPPHIDPNDTATGCAAHTTCRDCALSSSLCHWCGHDNMCHAVGSLYGCVTGVDCYDNRHCQRTIPEPIPHHSQPPNNGNDAEEDTDVPLYHRNIGILPLVLILSLSGIMICCATSCCCIMNCLKGAYDDLAMATIIVPPAPSSQPYTSNDDIIQTNEQDTEEYNPLLLSDTSPNSNNTLSVQPTNSTEDNYFDCRASTTDTTTTASACAKDNNTVTEHDTVAVTTTTTTTNEDCYIRMVDGGDDENHSDTAASPTIINQDRSNNSVVPTVSALLYRRTTTARPLPPRPPQHRRFVAMQRLYRTCMGCYVGTILCIGFVTYLTIYYFPQKPIYNICNDSVAWKSLIDSMTSFKATAEFQILASVYNPNPLDVALDMGKGSFAHNGETVGTYEIPPTVIASQAITDLLIVARFTPEKWQALSITAEYYSGNLVLHVNADASIRIPALFDYTISTSLQDIVVHVNALSDRRLCSCPTWSNNNGTSYHHPDRNPLEM